VTDAQIIAEFERLAAEAKPPQGPDYERILHIVTAKSGRDLTYVKQVIFDATITDPN